MKLTAPAYEAFVTLATDFVTANPEVLAIMIAGGVVGLIGFAVRKLSKAAR